MGTIHIKETLKLFSEKKKCPRYILHESPFFFTPPDNDGGC